MVQLTLRPAVSDDLEAVVEVHGAAIEELGPRSYTPRQVAAWRAEAVPSQYQFDDPDRRVLVAETSARVVAVGQANLDDPEVTKLFVAPEHAGQGIGATLLDALESLLCDAGAASAFLDASLNAVQFYHRHGYEFERVLNKHLPYDGEEVVYPTIRMRKRFDDTDD